MTIEKSFVVEVVDKETGKLIWTENHDSRESLNKAIKDLKENTFNPDFFFYSVKPSEVLSFDKVAEIDE